jgi:PIN domain nuclease of toxin-antitoxin system
MRLLLDTHILVWLLEGDSRLTSGARNLIVNAEAAFASSASIWEIAIKTRLGKLRIDTERMLDKLAQAGIDELPVSNLHAVATGKLPLIHHDPFDRLLIAQAITEPMRLLTADARLSAYSELVILI